MEAKRIAELPNRHSFRKERILCSFSFNQQVQPGLHHRPGFSLRGAAVYWSLWQLWQPQRLGRMVPERVWTGTRPGAQWLHNDATQRVPGLGGGATGGSQSLECHCPQPPWGPRLFVFGCSPPSQALPACCCCPLSMCSAYFARICVCVFFFNCSSDVQEKIRKADQPVRPALPLSDPK